MVITGDLYKFVHLQTNPPPTGTDNLAVLNAFLFFSEGEEAVFFIRICSHVPALQQCPLLEFSYWGHCIMHHVDTKYIVLGDGDNFKPLKISITMEYKQFLLFME